MVRSSREGKAICSSPSTRQVGFGRPARTEYHSKNQEQNLWSYMLCQVLHLHHNVNRNANFGRKQMSALELLNALAEYRLESIFPNLSVSLRMFFTAPATVALVKRSFTKLKLIKNYLRFTMSQDRLINLARLNIESDIAKQIDFDSVIRSFAKKKARKAMLCLIK